MTQRRQEIGMQIVRFQGQAAGLWVAALALLSADVQAQAQPTSGVIFSCTSASGKRLTADRPIAECLDREQRVLNKDGSLRMVLQPSLTADERAVVEDTERRKLQDRAALQDAIRRDRNLLARFPNEEAHGRARAAALDTARGSIQISEDRLAQLQRDRKPLVAETQFYEGKPLPPNLKGQLDTVDVSIEAQRSLVLTQQAEVARINANFDAELARLKQLWGGALPGSLGPLPQGMPAPVAKKP